MHMKEFCNGIKLGEAASGIVMDYHMQESEYAELKRQFQQERHAFFQLVTGAAGYRQKLLYLFVRFAMDAYEEYQVRGISDDVYFNTFSDIRIWSEVCCRDFGEYGIEEYNWLQEHVRLRLFRLGRMQFQPIAMEGDVKAGDVIVENKQLVLNVHIPEGGALSPQEVAHSFSLARAFFRGITPVFICQSWLLYPGLDHIMKSDSNILQFQRLFHIYEVDEAAKEAEQRIFNRVAADPSEYGEDTSLQHAAKAYLLAGGKLGRGSGIYVPID
ncbi:hypothetical protein D3P09_00145 [Paenibacillus pinisoli]|uniref:GNAT-like C-terminal domain-containing protein n=1 Tax=Paenibacillus pinisoli TaxID=1276110 RepID=A0A3A6PH65_9BACL|nr:acyltransferase domain-containing protein [Paenibacillus pinisoli]RJX40477.1 hypothetical protein D3P09_00145 [Paenibacillus pinisoli]